MKIAIVTPSLNQGQFIRDCIDSVLAQDGIEMDYWVIDGGSTDGTLDILRQYESAPRFHWLSEPDNGVTDAIEKGFARAKGDLMTWLNSDDYLIGQPLRRSTEIFAQNPQADLVYGRAHYIDASGRTIGTFGEPFHAIDTLSYRVSIPQQGALWRRALWERLDGIRQDLCCAFDVDFWLRAHEAGAHFYFDDAIRAAFRLHDDSISVGRLDNAWAERAKLAEEYLSHPHFAPHKRRIRQNVAIAQAGAYLRRGDYNSARQFAPQILRYITPSQRGLYGVWTAVKVWSRI